MSSRPNIGVCYTDAEAKTRNEELKKLMVKIRALFQDQLPFHTHEELADYLSEAYLAGRCDFGKQMSDGGLLKKGVVL